MGEILGNPGILGQGREVGGGGGGGVPSLPHPRMIPGWGRYLGILGCLDKGRGVPSSPHPRMVWETFKGLEGTTLVCSMGWYYLTPYQDVLRMGEILVQ